MGVTDSTDQASYMKTKSSTKQKRKKKTTATITTLKGKNQNPEVLNVDFQQEIMRHVKK